MTLRIEQDFAYIGNDYWSWRAWIAGAPSELERVKSVSWLLHPSFSPSVVTSEDASTGFRLETSGWGTFVLRAELLFRDGNRTQLRHELQLEYPQEQDPQGPPPRSVSGPNAAFEAVRAIAKRAVVKPPAAPDTGKLGFGRVFLSYGSADRLRAQAIRHSLRRLGLDVVDDTQLAPGAPWEPSISRLMADADATVAYVSSETPSPFVAQEISTSFSSGKPTIVLTDEEIGPIVGIHENVPVKRIDLSDARELAQTLNDLKPE